ncbi:MAG TPA: ribosome small subunit-dependent GTPase A, partial [Spirochaetia bacterium]|nr:ribosome small subunit-dependent GTPase A [Spirochaetia bacterium]
MTNDYSPEGWGWRREHHASYERMAGPWPAARAMLPARVTGRDRGAYRIVAPDFSGRPGFEAAAVSAAAGRAGAPGEYSGVALSGAYARAIEEADSGDEGRAAGVLEYPACGDWVLVDLDGGYPRIQATLGRLSSVARGRAGRTSEAQVIAANIDTLVVVLALDGGRNFLPRLAERALVLARASGAAPVLALNKRDLADEETRLAAEAELSRLAPGVPVLSTSARTGEGIAELAALFGPGETIALLGKSGMGKSALVNALAGAGSGEDRALEGEVRDGDRRGRHTTTASRLYRLASGLLVVDAPGFRELKVLGDEDATADVFAEVAELASGCRFSDCTHTNEPGCAVRAAL